MRLYTVQVKTPVGGVNRLMAEDDGMLVDLNAAGGVYYQAQGYTNPQQLADANLPNDMITFFHNGERSLSAGTETLRFIREKTPAQGLEGQQLVYRLCDVTVLAPVTRPNIQSGSTVVGTGAPLYKPSYTSQFDFEFEMGFYIGKRGFSIKPEEALDYVAGFTVFNDVSARDAQADEAVMALGPAKGKFFRNSLVMGPCVVTKDELPDYDDLAMTARVNGEIVTENRTSGMLFSLGQLVAQISEDVYLNPGDFIGLGTSPEGNTTCSKLGRWLQAGDEIEFTIEKIGTIRNRVEEA